MQLRSLAGCALLVLLVGCNNAPPSRTEPAAAEHRSAEQPSPDDGGVVTFVGTVTAIEMLGERALTVLPVHFDPNFAVTVHVDAITQGEAPFEAGADTTFAVHSPTLLFPYEGAQNAIGKKYLFRLRSAGSRGYSFRIFGGPVGRLKFYGMTAEPVKE